MPAPQSSAPYDALIIGGGHNGLVCACYLAARGMKVRVLERRHILGGAAVTEEFHSDSAGVFRNSTASYTVSLLHPGIIRDLRLHEHGLRIVERPFSNFLPLPGGRGEQAYLKLGGGLEASQREVAKFSTRDAERLPAFYAMLDGVVGVLRAMLVKTPPNVGERSFHSLTDWWNAWDLGKRVARLDLPHKRDLLDLFTKSAGDVLDSWFESDAIKAALGFDSIVGNFASPYASGSAYVLLHHVFGEIHGKSGVWGHAIGGMGAITLAMAREAAERGVELSTDAAVARVLVETHRGKKRAAGVMLENGTRILARRIVANVHPQMLFLSMLDAADLPEDFVNRIKHYRSGSGTLRMNVALCELPDFTALPGTHAQPHHSSGIVMAPSLAMMERAWMDAKSFGWSSEPIIEMLIPSTIDETLAPRGAHVASLFCQHFAPRLEASGAAARYPEGWAETHLPGSPHPSPRESAADAVIDAVTRYAPNFKASVIARQIHTPLDLEKKFGLIGGDIFHGALTLDQLFSARPVLGHANYRAPIAALYLCGAGAHPGGGVSGLPGKNAAREILRDRR